MLSEVYLLNLVAAVWLKHLRWGSPSSLLSPLLLSPFSFSVAFSHPGALLLPCIGETAWIALGQLWDGRGKLRQEKVSRQQSQGSTCCEVSGMSQSILNPLQKLRWPSSCLNLIRRLLQPSGCPLNLGAENGNVRRLLISHCSTTLFRFLWSCGHWGILG